MFMHIDAVLINKVYLKGKISKIWIHPFICLLNKYMLHAYTCPLFGILRMNFRNSHEIGGICQVDSLGE